MKKWIATRKLGSRRRGSRTCPNTLTSSRYCPHLETLISDVAAPVSALGIAGSLALRLCEPSLSNAAGALASEDA